MSQRKEKFVQGEYYHIFNRGVDQRDIFLDEQDYHRFLESMMEFHGMNPIGSLYEYRFHKDGIEKEFGPPDPLIHFICYCLNPNHYHFVVEQVADNGVEQFMQRIGTGYTMYFNKRYGRGGSLFQGKFKAVHITTNEYLLHVSVYVNLNNKIHKLGGKASKSSWNEYMQGIPDTHKEAFCKKSIVLGQFNSSDEYRQYAEKNLPLIQDRKDLRKFFF